MGTLYYGDNLPILREKIEKESVDLVYLDPPFNSAAAYNAFFPGKTGAAASQIKAFEDTWHWVNKDNASITELQTIIGDKRTPDAVKKLLQAYHDFLGGCDMLAYLTMMAPRLVELHRVLKPTGSLYLHCDPTASHYLKLLLDAVFGPVNFQNEIVWRRYKRPKGSQFTARKFGASTDCILFFTKSDKYEFYIDRIKADLSEEAIEQRYNLADDKGSYYSGPLLRSQSMGTRPNLVYEYKGYTPGPSGWRMTKEKLAELDANGDMFFTSNGVPRRKVRPQDEPGTLIDNLWIDIEAIGSQAKERLHYPTQKPLALMERIIEASSNAGDVVLDPFCGCGTTIDAAEELGRAWIGIDITQIAIATIKDRLVKRYKETKAIKFLHESDPAYKATGNEMVVRVFGEPATPEDAAALAKEDEYGFQWWVAYNLVGGQGPKKKGGDGGIDGKIIFFDDPQSASGEEILLQIKGGKVKADDVRALGFVIEREKAAMGVLISIEPPTEKMYADASKAGDYTHKLTGQKFPRLQLRTVKELMEGKGIARPSESAAKDGTFKAAPKAKAKDDQQHKMKL